VVHLLLDLILLMTSTLGSTFFPLISVKCCVHRFNVSPYAPDNAWSTSVSHPESTGELVSLLRSLPRAVEINSRVQTEIKSISFFPLQIAQNYCAVTTTMTTTTTVVSKLAEMKKAQTRNADFKNNNEVCITTPHTYHRRLLNGQKYGEQNHITATTNSRRSSVQNSVVVTEKKEGDCLHV